MCWRSFNGGIFIELWTSCTFVIFTQSWDYKKDQDKVHYVLIRLSTEKEPNQKVEEIEKKVPGTFEEMEQLDFRDSWWIVIVSFVESDWNKEKKS